MPNYANSKVYSIRSHQTDQIYIGSTTQKLSMRMASHRRNFKSWKAGKYNYTTSFEILKYGDAYIELLMDCPCENSAQLAAVEGRCIRACQVSVNKRIAAQKKHYHETHKEQILAKQKKYDHTHKAEAKAYYEANKGTYYCPECDRSYADKGALTRHKKTQKHIDMVELLIECVGPDYNSPDL